MKNKHFYSTKYFHGFSVFVGETRKRITFAFIGYLLLHTLLVITVFEPSAKQVVVFCLSSLLYLSVVYWGIIVSMDYFKFRISDSQNEIKELKKGLRDIGFEFQVVKNQLFELGSSYIIDQSSIVQIQKETNNSTQLGKSANQKNLISKELLKQIKKSASQLNLHENVERIVDEHLNNLDVQISSSKPDSNIILSSLKSLKSIFENTVGGVLAVEITRLHTKIYTG